MTLGLMTLPFVLAKLWSVMPKLFQRPVVSSFANALERISLLALVASVLVEFATGILDVDDYFGGPLDFNTVHYYGAWVFGTLFVLHACVKLPTVRRAYRTRGALKPLLEGLPQTAPEPPVAGGLAPTNPAAPTISRRGLLAMVGGASLTIFAVEAGQVDRWAVQTSGVARAARARVRNRTQRLPGHPHRRHGPDHAGDDWPGLALDGRRRTNSVAHARGTPGDGSGDPHDHDHVYGRMVDNPALDRGASRRSGSVG